MISSTVLKSYISVLKYKNIIKLIEPYPGMPKDYVRLQVGQYTNDHWGLHIGLLMPKD